MNLGKNSPTDNLPCTFVIFGATGNLASNKLLPALYHLEAAARLTESLSIIAFSRREKAMSESDSDSREAASR